MKLALILLFVVCMVNAVPFNTCPLEDISYYAGGGKYVARFDDISSWQDCGMICNRIVSPVRCNFWSWYPTLSNICLLFEEDTWIEVYEGAYSGNADCDGSISTNTSINLDKSI